jgi:hypothetical protein
MTITVAFLCSDGVVVGVDSMLTPSFGNIAVGHHTGRKLHILTGPQICGIAGDFGLAARFRTMADASSAAIAAAAHPLNYGLQLAQGMAAQLAATGLANVNIDLGTVLAYAHGGLAHCCAFLGRVQPWLLDVDHYYVALGSGKLSADPFLRFLTDTFCNGPTTVREAVFLSTWTIQHVIDTNPGGVAGPIRIAVLENVNNQWQARELPVDEIAEHQQAIESAATALRTWRDELQSGQAAEDAPEPPAAPAGGTAPAPGAPSAPRR